MEDDWQNRQGGTVLSPIRRFRVGLGLALTCLLVSCGQDAPEAEPDVETATPLRVAVRNAPSSYLPRSARSAGLDRKITEGLAQHLGREIEWVLLDRYSEQVAALSAGQVDIIAGNLTERDAADSTVAFSLPYFSIDELVIVPAPIASSIHSIDDLAGCELAVRASSSFYASILNMQEKVDIRVQILPEEMRTEEVLESVARGRIPGTVLHSNDWAAIAPFQEGLSAPVALVENLPVVLGLHPEASELRTKVNEFLIFHALTGEREDVYLDDLSSLQGRKRLRVLTRNNATTYFLHRGTPLGFEYELLKKFAESQGMVLEIVIPPSASELIPWLEAGRGDIIAAAMTITPEREERIDFSRHYLKVEQVIVTRSDIPPVEAWGDLRGKSIAVRESSAFYETLQGLVAEMDGVSLLVTPEEMETERILALVESGALDAAICDSHILEIEQTYGRSLRSAFSVRETDLGWGVRPNNPDLRAALDRFLDKEYRGLFYNVIYRRYFHDPKYVEMSRDDYRSDVSGRISPYDELAQIYAERNDLDWRLLVALMYQESGFDPESRSWAGARGLTQVMPRTAKELGVTDLTDPSQSVRAGATYLRSLLNRFETDLKLEDRIRFALASYNAGAGHVQDARHLARKMNWDPDRWFGNVERAMLLLQKPAYYGKARFGYCRGSETVRYVRQIEELYRRFVDHVPDRAELAEPDTLATGLSATGIR